MLREKYQAGRRAWPIRLAAALIVALGALIFIWINSQVVDVVTLPAPPSTAIMISNCQPTDISQAEAKQLVLQAVALTASPDTKFDAEPSQSSGPPDNWTFRAFALNGTSTSNLMGWYSVNKQTAALSDPVLGTPIILPALSAEQSRQRVAHCSK